MGKVRLERQLVNKNLKNAVEIGQPAPSFSLWIPILALIKKNAVESTELYQRGNASSQRILKKTFCNSERNKCKQKMAKILLKNDNA